MLVKILIVIAILGVISYFKEKVWLKWLIFIFAVCCLTEVIFIFGWHANNYDAKEEIPIYEKENAEIDRQITDIKKELLQGNLTEEKLDNILETYQELESKRQDNNEKIEDYEAWLEFGRKNIEDFLFF